MSRKTMMEAFHYTVERVRYYFESMRDQGPGLFNFSMDTHHSVTFRVEKDVDANTVPPEIGIKFLVDKLVFWEELFGSNTLT